MLKRILLILACFAMLFLTVSAKADLWDKKTTLTFSEWVQLPGFLLPPGSYVFMLVDTPGVRTTVRVLDADDNEVLGTFFAIPTEHAKAVDKTYIGFEERSGGMPEAIHEWLYPGDNYGLEFVYR